ncbi:MAG: hypothetical protein EZS28_031757, partial [Streblomastix strix]
EFMFGSAELERICGFKILLSD